MPSPDATEPFRRPRRAPINRRMPIRVQPVPRPRWPKIITNLRILTGVQVALVMIGGNCSFGIPLAAAIAWPVEWLDLHEDPGGIAIILAWVVGLAAILTYAYFTNHWAGEADRRARTTIIIGTAVLVGLTALTIPIMVLLPDLTTIMLTAAAPSLILQAIALRCVYGPQGRRWFDGNGLN